MYQESNSQYSFLTYLGRKFSENCQFCFKDATCKRQSLMNQFCHVSQKEFFNPVTEKKCIHRFVNENTSTETSKRNSETFYFVFRN